MGPIFIVLSPVKTVVVAFRRFRELFEDFNSGQVGDFQVAIGGGFWVAIRVRIRHSGKFTLHHQKGRL